MEDNYDLKDSDDLKVGSDQEKTGFAITSLVLGICSIAACLGPITGIPGIILGHIARTKAKKGEGGGARMALAGLITGYLGTFFIATYMVAIVFPTISQTREAARKIVCIQNLKNIGVCFLMYTNANNEKFPSSDGAAGFEVLRKTLKMDPKVFQCPSTSDKASSPLTEPNTSYVYFGGFTEDDSIDVPLAFDKPSNHEKFVHILYLDGRVNGYSGKFKTSKDVIEFLILNNDYSEELQTILRKKAKAADNR